MKKKREIFPKPIKRRMAYSNATFADGPEEVFARKVIAGAIPARLKVTVVPALSSSNVASVAVIWPEDANGGDEIIQGVLVAIRWLLDNAPDVAGVKFTNKAN